MTATEPIVVVGAGSWGTALAATLARRGAPTTLWARETEVARGIETSRHNPLFLSDVELPAELRATDDLTAALEGATIVLSVVPTQFVRSVFSGRADALAAADIVATASKGIEAETLMTPHQILAEVGAPEHHLVALSGPSFAQEVATGLPTAIVAAGPDRHRARRMRDLLAGDRLRLYSSDDIVGVELGGALKNVIAIAAGVCDGLELGNNTRAAIITRGLAEIARLGVACGGDARTFAGLSGMGDLVLTCTGGLSRNRSVGLALGAGETLAQVMEHMNEVAEGVATSRSARRLGEARGVEMPITEQVDQILHEGKDPRVAVLELTSRQLRDEPD